MNIFTLMGTILVDNSKANESISKTGKESEGLANKLGSGLANAAKIAGAAILAIGVAASGMAIKAVSASDDCKKALNNLQTQTGATNEEMEGLKGSLLSIYGANYGESFEDVASALASVKQQTNLTGQELENTAKNAIVLRDTFDWEVDEQLNAVNQLVKNFGISSDEAFNLIAQGAQNGLNAQGDLMDIVKEYSVHFAQLGLDSEDMFNILKNGAETGAFSMDKLGDALKEFGIRLKAGDADESLTSLGLNADELKRKFNEGGESAKQAFQQVNKALVECEDVTLRNQYATSMYGTMWEDLGVEATLALSNINGEFDSTINTMQQIDSIKYDSFGEAMAGIGRQVEVGILVPLGDSLMPLLNDFANWINSHMPEIQSVIEVAMEGVRIAVEVASDIFNTLVDAIKYLLPVLQQLSPIIAGVVAGFAAFQIITTVSSLFTTLSGIVATVTATITAAGGVTAALGAAVAAIASPITIAVAAIGALVAALVYLYNNNEDVRNALNECWEAIKQLFSSAVEVIKGVINTFVEVFKTIWSKYGTDIQEIIQKVWDYIGQVFKTAIDLITDIFKVFSAAFQGDWSGMWEAVKELVSNLWNNITELLKAWLDLLVVSIVNIGQAMLEAGKEIFNKLWEGIKNVWQSIKTWLEAAKQDPIKTITGIGSAMFNAGKEIFSKLWEGIKNVWSGIQSWVSDKVNWIKDKVMFWQKSESSMDKSKADGSHAGGINSVPYDGYLAELHKGERVLTASENNALNDEDQAREPNVQPIIINMYYPQVNSKDNIKTTSRQLREQILSGDRALGLKGR
ncbi:hypothetical protein CS063_00080 [Sporanaerobium hydrogeniformans]|uniref:Uncharacterized protein n=1 Tax=Sporanaerobium hydrogeniformans TaxID=3072179 RepID=A0AC61DF88_9FIRM|nr:phage tail tape measure protein [Sporanaerobium hydrogeniformans]PHV71914.1 hypothetical protein CS063_00080 [Sporanaerobium hydrogeniformans]